MTLIAKNCRPRMRGGRVPVVLVEVEHTRGTCAGHPALARAIATLLRCQRAQLNQRAANTAAAAKVSGIVGAILIGVIEAAKHLFGK